MKEILEAVEKNRGLTLAEGITGFYTLLDTGREGPEVLDKLSGLAPSPT